jgi:hypothetical protein
MTKPMSKVNTSERFRMQRQTGPDYRVRKADVERSMSDKTVLQKMYNEKLKSYKKEITFYYKTVQID